MEAERISTGSIDMVLLRMMERQNSLNQWSKENQNDIGGFFGSIANAMGDLEVAPEMIRDTISELSEYGELYFSPLPTCTHEDIVISTVRRKERSLEQFKINAMRDMNEGWSLYLNSIVWQKPYELFGVRTEGFFVTQMAKYKRK